MEVFTKVGCKRRLYTVSFAGRMVKIEGDFLGNITISGRNKTNLINTILHGLHTIFAGQYAGCFFEEFRKIGWFIKSQAIGNFGHRKIRSMQ